MRAFIDGVLKRPGRLLAIAAIEAGTWLLDTAAKSIGATFTAVMWSLIIAWCTMSPWIAEERHSDPRKLGEMAEHKHG